MKHQHGIIIVISGPSGVGKGTIIKQLMGDATLKLNYSISATTRPIRADETDGINYFYKTRQQFQAMIANRELLEYATYVDNYYGTPLSSVNEILNRGENLLLEIEYQGVIQVLEKIPEAVTIFIEPPSFAELHERLIHRGSETSAVIADRISQAQEEYRHKEIFKYVIINDDLNNAVLAIKKIILKEMNHGSI